MLLKTKIKKVFFPVSQNLLLRVGGVSRYHRPDGFQSGNCPFSKKFEVSSSKCKIPFLGKGKRKRTKKKNEKKKKDRKRKTREEKGMKRKKEGRKKGKRTEKRRKGKESSDIKR